MDSIERINNIKGRISEEMRDLKAKEHLCNQYIQERKFNNSEKTVILVADCMDYNEWALIHLGGGINTKYGDHGIVIGFDKYDENGEPQEVIFLHDEDDERRVNVDRISVMGW